MSRMSALVLVLALGCGCASKPPQGAVEEAGRAVRDNPKIAELFGNYTAAYAEDRSLQSASVGTRVEFDLSGDKGSGEATVQLGAPRSEGPWAADAVDVTLFQRTQLRWREGAWQVEPR